MLIHLNKQIVPLAEARISPLDRGFIFGDGIYEGIRAVAAPARHAPHIFALDRHIDRMRGCLDAARIPFDPAPLKQWSYDLLRANNLADAFLYWQITRGTPGPTDPPRSRIPPANMQPTILGFCAPQPPLSAFAEPPTRRAVTLEDIRWLRGRIKTTSMLGNVMLTMEADAGGGGAEDAIFTRNGLVAEGTATNIIIALPSGEIATPSLDSVPILAGVTRGVLLELEPEIRQRPIRAEELDTATEIMLVGTTSMVTSIVELNGRRVGDGAPGPVATRLLKLLIDAIRTEAAPKA